MKYKYWYYTLTGQRARLARIMDALKWRFYFEENDQLIGINANGIHAVIWMNSYPCEKEGFKFCYKLIGNSDWQHSNNLLDILARIDYRVYLRKKQDKCKLTGIAEIIRQATVHDYLTMLREAKI